MQIGSYANINYFKNQGPVVFSTFMKSIEHSEIMLKIEKYKQLR